MGLTAFRNLEYLLEFLDPRFREYAPAGTFTTACLRTGLYLVVAILLWVNSAKFWPSDNPMPRETTMDMNAWLRIAMIVLGIYFITFSAPVVLMVLVKGAVQSNIKWPEFSAREIFTECCTAVVAIGLIICGSIGWKKPAIEKGNQ